MTVPQKLCTGTCGIDFDGLSSFANLSSSCENAAVCTLIKYWDGDGFGVGKSMSKTVSESTLGFSREELSRRAVEAGHQYRALIVSGTKVCSSIVVERRLAGFILVCGGISDS